MVISSNPLFNVSWPQSKAQSAPSLQRHMKSLWPFAVTGPSFLQFPASLAHQFNFWSLIRAQACHAACTHHLLQGQAAVHYFAGNAVVLAHSILYFGVLHSSNLSVEAQIQSAHPKPALTSIKQHKAQQSLDTCGLVASFLIPFILPYQLYCHFAGNSLPFSSGNDQCTVSWWLMNFEYIACICISHM